MAKCILIIGVRRQCYKAALSLGHQVILWSDGKLNENRKKKLTGWIEEPYLQNDPILSAKAINELKKYSIDHVIANTEETVILGARVRAHLGLKRLAVDVTERFHNKWVMKKMAQQFNIPITNYRLIDQDTRAIDLERELKLPIVIKPVDESGAQDVKIAKNLDEIEKYMSPGLLAESFVTGEEVSVETFVQEGRPIFHNITQYLHQWRKSITPAQLDENLKVKILKINDDIIQAFGVDRGMTHAEFYLTNEGPVFGEIAIRPPGGYYMDLIEKVYGFDSWKLYVELSCGHKTPDFSALAKGCAAVYMIHPGAGIVKSINGVEEIKNKIKGIFQFSIRCQAGDIILPHENTSNEVGHILFWAPTHEQLLTELAFIESTLKFEWQSES